MKFDRNDPAFPIQFVNPSHTGLTKREWLIGQYIMSGTAIPVKRADEVCEELEAESE